MEQSVYKLLTLNKNVVVATFNRLVQIKGLWCSITKPAPENKLSSQYEIGKNGSIFGMEDLVEYEELEPQREKLLVFNLFKEGISGFNDFDTFTTEQPYILTLYKDRLPLQTLIEVDFYGKHMNFKVDSHNNLTPSVTEPLLLKHILVPAT